MNEPKRTELKYWDKHYKTGGKSGRGSVGSYRKWKWKVIKKYVNIKKSTVLDVGCGDISFMKGKKPNEYTGIDISQTIIERNQTSKPDWNFVLIDATVRAPSRFKMDVVLCMDMLFHIMDDLRFGDLLMNLNDWTGTYLFMVNWSKNPLPYVNDNYQYFRNLRDWFDYLLDFELIAEHQKKGDEFNTLYVFKRRM